MVDTNLAEYLLDVMERHYAEEWWSVADWTKIAELPSSANIHRQVKAALEHLHKKGLVERAKQGRTLLYMLNLEAFRGRAV